MNIALLGYGRMGKAIETIAQDRGHIIVARWDDTTQSDPLHSADVAINFSVPSAAVTNIQAAFEANVPVVCGTTGWLDHYAAIVEEAKSKNQGFLYASNFSVGVNLFFALNKHLAQLMAPYTDYKASLEEIHHIHKLDAPSGTAITLAEGIQQNNPLYQGWSLESAQEQQLTIKALREPDVPGTHTVSYQSNIDAIEIKHEAFNRQGFALGAVLAAEWLQGKKGIFSMNEVLNIKA
ncbi:MAG: 4-hydroxy-tetrahydrodipicolinate reductase [Flavobacteriaceae bacterium]